MLFSRSELSSVTNMETFIFMEKEKFLLIVSAQYCRKFWCHSPRSISFLEHQHAWNEQNKRFGNLHSGESPTSTGKRVEPPATSSLEAQDTSLEVSLDQSYPTQKWLESRLLCLIWWQIIANPWETLSKPLTFKQWPWDYWPILLSP